MNYRFRLAHPESDSVSHKMIEAPDLNTAQNLLHGYVGCMVEQLDICLEPLFTHLHAHTTFSFLDGYGTPDQLATRLKELGHDHAAITDHGNIIAHVPCAQAYQKAGVKPVFGCEFYICDDLTQRSKMHAPSLGYECLPHITVLARTQQGYSNLLKLSRLSYEHGFYFKPRIDFASLIQHKEGLVVLSGCPTGYPTRAIVDCDRVDFARQLMYELKQQLGDDYYVEIVPQPQWHVSQKAAPILWQLACELQIPVIITADAHFPKPEDYLAQDALLAVGLKETVLQEVRKLKLPYYQYYCSGAEILERAQSVLPDVPLDQLIVAVENSWRVGESCNAELKKARPVTFPGIPEGMDAGSLLWQWCMEGLNQRYLEGRIKHELWQEYVDRATREYVVLSSKGFCDYMLAIIDVICWMKQNDALIMTRGSAGGCLLLWLAGASETDPIKHGLSFERFYDDTRPDPPDVDIDFEQCRRDEAIEYIYNKYGRDKCSQIAALSRLGPLGAVQDAASALGIHRREFGVLSDVINDKDFDLERQLNSITDPKARAVLSQYPLLAKLACGMVGQYRHSSVHAAGVLVSSDPLQDVIGVLVSNGRPVAAVDKRGAASLGFLKIDMLSVQGLDVTGLAARSASSRVSWLYQLDKDDPLVFRTANEGRLAGVFQLDGASAKRALAEIGANTFEDLVAASVLCRPGASDSIPIYKRHKYDPAAFATYLSSMHPVVADIVKETYGVLMYQEQVMRIAREVAGLEWKLVHRLRKEVADKLGLDPQKGDAWRAEWHELFVGGCIKNGMSLAEATRWWEAVQVHGGYSFNKSHGFTYGVVGYWMLYLKTYHPASFYEAYLKLEKDDVVKKRIVKEFQLAGGRVDVISAEHSGESFRAHGLNALVGGYSDLKFCGEANARKVSQGGPYQSTEALLAALPKRTRELLLQAGVLTGKWDPTVLVEVAPWMPVPCYAEQDQDTKARLGMRGVSEMPDYKLDGDVITCGYVTWTKFEKDKVWFMLEDDRGMAMVRIAAGRLKDLGPVFRTINVGEFIAVEGWWTGDTMFAKSFAKLRGK